MSSTSLHLARLFSRSRSGWAAATQLVHVLENWEAGERKHGNGFRGAIHGLVAAQLAQSLTSAANDESAAYALWGMLTRVENAFRKEGDEVETPAIIQNLLLTMETFQHEAESLVGKPKRPGRSLSDEDDESVLGASGPDELELDAVDGGSDLQLTVADADIGDSGLSIGLSDLHAELTSAQPRTNAASDFDQMVVETVSGKRDPDLALGLIAIDSEDDRVIALDSAQDILGLDELDELELELDLEVESARIGRERRQHGSGSDGSLI